MRAHLSQIIPKHKWAVYAEGSERGLHREGRPQGEVVAGSRMQRVEHCVWSGCLLLVYCNGVEKTSKLTQEPNRGQPSFRRHFV